MFAKLYGTDDDQVLVMLDADDKGDPCVKFSCKPKDMGVCSFFLGFPDTDEGHENAEAAFAKIDEAQAREIVASTIMATLPKAVQQEG